MAWSIGEGRGGARGEMGGGEWEGRNEECRCMQGYGAQGHGRVPTGLNAVYPLRGQ